MKTIVVLFALAAPLPAMGQDWNVESCSAALERAYAPFSARAGSSTRGDFNSDGSSDVALFVDRGRGAHPSAIGVCLSNEPRPLLVTAPYATGTISTKPHGTPYTDRETGKKGIYERDAIFVSDGEATSASYVLRVGVFARVVE